MSDFFDRQGKPLTLLQWGELFENASYSRIAFDKVGGVEVSTVWIGLDLGRGHRPLIFETMAFTNDGDLRRRHTTEDGATAFHKALVAAVREGKQVAEVFDAIP